MPHRHHHVPSHTRGQSSGPAICVPSDYLEQNYDFPPCLPLSQASFPGPSPTQAHSKVTEGPEVKIEEQMLIEQVEQGPTAICSHLLHQQLG